MAGPGVCVAPGPRAPGGRAGGGGGPAPRETGLCCVRCDRPACSACLREAPVGYQCVDCVAAGTRSRPRATTVAGAEPTGRSVVVPALVAINVVVFAITVAQAGSVRGNSAAELFKQWGLWPTAVAGGELWRLFTSGFLHFGPIHLAFNMIALWVIGRDLEQVLGQARFLAVYLVSLLGGVTRRNMGLWVNRQRGLIWHDRVIVVGTALVVEPVPQRDRHTEKPLA